MKKRPQLALPGKRAPAPVTVNSPEPRDRARRLTSLTKWQKLFLRALREEPNIKRACSAAGVSRSRAYRRREVDAVFAAEWQDALESAVDSLEATAFKLASEGDSNILTFLLRCHRPETYRETSRYEVDARLCGIVVVPPKEDKAP